MTGTSSPLPVGLVGLGALSQRALLPHFALPDARARIDMLAVCDVNQERARLTSEKYEVPEYYSNLDEMLRAAPVEAVLIATPIHLHYAQAMAALEADKHVYIQKPAATNLEQCRQIFQKADRRRRLVLASPVQMLNPTREFARVQLTAGAIGPVYWALCTANAPGHEKELARLGNDPLRSIDPSWYFKTEGGPVFDMTIYALDALVGLLGPVVQVGSFSGIRVPTRQWKGQDIRVDTDDNALLMLDFGENVFAVVSGSNAHSGRRVAWGDVSIFGAEGAMEIYSDNTAEPNLANVVEVVGGEKQIIRDFGPHLPPEHARMPDPHVYADIMHFIDGITTGTPMVASAERTCHVIEIMEKSSEAARNGRTQAISTTIKPRNEIN